MNLDHFGMDTITLAGPLEAKLSAIRGAGFTQVMLSAADLVGHPGGEDAAVAAVRASGLRVTGFQVLRDFEGLSGHLHAYKVDVAKAMLRMCRALDSEVQLSDFMWEEIRSPDDRIETARHYRVFPGEGVHSARVAEMVRSLDGMGYRGDYSFEVFNDDYRQLPLPMVAERARLSVKWISGLVSRRSLPARRSGGAAAAP